jgi:predicted naringenin-chalcone synthase
VTTLVHGLSGAHAANSVESNGAILVGLGTAVPLLHWSGEQTFNNMAAVWNLSGAALERWRRIVEGSEIERRHGVLPPDLAARLTTAQRMREYELHAPPLAEQAARRALAAAGIAPAQVTDVVIVSCTGFSAPGVDVALIERLGLAATTRRTTIGFMGCFGAINGLRVAAGLCAADPQALALVVCVELCSLHMRAEPDVQNQVASALFADGAAAVVVAGASAFESVAFDPNQRDVRRWASRFDAATSKGPLALARLASGSSLLLPEGKEWMTWRITDSGFAMTLAREVPVALREALGPFVRQCAAETNTFIVHPGGPGVLDAVDDALALNGASGIECSRDILRRFGNMSSGTVLFVLEAAMRRGNKFPMLMLAFGPGLTIEALRLENVQVG